MKNLPPAFFCLIRITILSLVLSFAIATDMLSHTSEIKEWDLGSSWIISPAQAVKMKKEGAILLDARGILRRYLPIVSGAKQVGWEDFSESHFPDKGKLLKREKLIPIFQKLGIGKKNVIIVIGDPLQGWGEDGRVVWSLRSNGYVNSFWVDGGARAYEKFSLGGGQEIKTDLPKEDSRISKSFDSDKSHIQESLPNLGKQISILDVREEREYLGATPYGESRGGHIPGAKWIYFKDFLDEEGFLKSKEEATKILISKQIRANTKIISYCSGGVRSAWTTSVLVSFGYDASNYSGSMWEWSAMDEERYPLTNGK